jgi:hypothetical protein
MAAGSFSKCDATFSRGDKAGAAGVSRLGCAEHVRGDGGRLGGKRYGSKTPGGAGTWENGGLDSSGHGREKRWELSCREAGTESGHRGGELTQTREQTHFEGEERVKRTLE